jgi:hypothetical protein
MFSFVPGLVVERHGRWNIGRVHFVSTLPRLVLHFGSLFSSTTNDLGDAVLAKILVEGHINLGLSSVRGHLLFKSVSKCEKI